MFGWMILFALIVVAGAVQTIAGNGAASAKLVSTLFAILFLMAVAARATRGRAW